MKRKGLFTSSDFIGHDNRKQGNDFPDVRDWQSLNLLNGIHCAIAIVDKTGIIRVVNDRLTTVSGYTKQELEGASLHLLIPERYHNSHEEHLTFFHENPHMRRMGSGINIVVRHKNGKELPVEIGLSPMFVADEMVTVATIIDISIYKAIEQELNQEIYLARIDLQAIINNLPAVIGYWDSNLRNRFGNGAYQDWFGFAPEQMKGKHIREVIGEELFTKNQLYIQKALNGKVQVFEQIILAPDGRFRHSHTVYTPDFRDGIVQGFYAVVSDISEYKHAVEALFAEKERAQVTLSSIGDGVITTDNEGKVNYLNPIAEEMTGWSTAEAMGVVVEQVMALRNGLTGEQMTNPIRWALQQNRIVSMETNCVLQSRSDERTDGGCNIEDSAAPIRDTNQTTIGAVIVFHDISESRAMAIKMSHMAQHDPLTDLPNRLLLQDRISQAIQFAKRSDTAFAIMFLDLDNFKNVNDSLGHAAGDVLLYSVAKRLTGALRTTDTVSRQGGDEFIVLLSEVDSAEHAGQTAQRLLDIISEPYEIDGERVIVTLSIGISLYPEDGEEAEALIRHADAAMYPAKKSGRNRYQFFSKEIAEAVLFRRILEREIHDALETEQFSMYYQLKVNSVTNKVIGTEALVRWNRPDGTIYSPALFIPLAEESGQIRHLGQFVLREACRQNKLWQNSGLPPTTVAVNISAVQLRYGDFIPMVERILKETGLSPQYLELEITEGTLIDSIEETRAALNQLRAMKVRIALDDFGTGYSSLSYLKRFPMDTLKIDQSFVADLLDNANDSAIISAIIGIGRSLGLEVIAEGVETEEQAKYLRSLECPLMQGYLFSRPLTAEQATVAMTARGSQTTRFLPVSLA